MQFEVRIPRFLTTATKGETPIKVETEELTVRGVLRSVIAEYPDLEKSIFTEGELHHHLNVFVDLEDIRFLGGLSLELAQGQKIDLLAAVAGG